MAAGTEKASFLPDCEAGRRRDVDLTAKLAEWENFYNYHRPHGAFQGKTPYEALREKLG